MSGKVPTCFSRRRTHPKVVSLKFMRRLAVGVLLAAALSSGACSIALQGIPKTTAIESTFPAKAAATELPEQLKVVAFNVHKEHAAKFIKGMQADRATRDADL